MNSLPIQTNRNLTMQSKTGKRIIFLNKNAKILKKILKIFNINAKNFNKIPIKMKKYAKCKNKNMTN